MHREVLIYSDLDVTDRSSLRGKYSQRIARKAAVKFTHIDAFAPAESDSATLPPFAR